MVSEAFVGRDAILEAHIHFELPAIPALQAMANGAFHPWLPATQELPRRRHHKGECR